MKNLKTQNLAVELLQYLLLDRIRSNTRFNVVQEKKYSKRLLRKYKYPSEGQEEAVGRIIEQVEALADSWLS